VATSENGRFVVVGAPQEKAVYIFLTPTTLPTGVPGYTQVNKLTSTDEGFGWSVDINSSAEWIVIGAPGFNNNQGRIHVYSRTASGGTWGAATTPTYTLTGTGTLQAALTPNFRGHRFGHSVAIKDASTLTSVDILVGCPYYTLNPNVSGINSGACFAYRFTGGPSWAEQIIIPSDAEQEDLFGWDVAMTSDGLNSVISSLDDDDKGIKSGSVYVYTFSVSTWNFSRKLVASDGSQDDWFGHSVDIGYNGADVFVAVGAPNKVDPIPYEGFGFNVSLNGCGSVLAASSIPKSNSYEEFSGFVTVLVRTSTTLWGYEQQRFVGQAYNDGYGYALDINESGSHFITSGPFNNQKTGYTQLISLQSDCYNMTANCNGQDIFSSSSSSSHSSSSTSSDSSNSSSSSSSNSSSSKSSNSSSSYSSSSSSSFDTRINLVSFGSASGSYVYNTSNIVFSTNGADIWGTSDSGSYLYRQVTGDYTMSMRVDSYNLVDRSQRVGIMFRASTSANSAHAFGCVSPADFNGVSPTYGATFSFRSSTSNTTSRTYRADNLFTAPNSWIRLERIGSTFNFYTSPNGSTWTLRASQSLPNIPTTCLIGIAGTSKSLVSTMTSTVSNITPIL
jgi:hypothetical protein